jgi:hypothetical protein
MTQAFSNFAEVGNGFRFETFAEDGRKIAVITVETGGVRNADVQWRMSFAFAIDGREVVTGWGFMPFSAFAEWRRQIKGAASLPGVDN